MKKIFILVFLSFVFLTGGKLFPQADNVITQYDPYIFSLKKLTFYYPDDDQLTANSKFVIVIRANLGSNADAFIKFITPDKIGFDSFKDFKDGVLQEISLLDKKGVLVPPLKDIAGKNFLELQIGGYADLTDLDFEKIKKISAADIIPVSTALIELFSGIYFNYPYKNDVLNPSDELWAEAQSFLAGIDTRKKIELGNIVFSVPMLTDVKNIKFAENLVFGDRAVENKKQDMFGIINFKQIKDEEMVNQMDYYVKVKEIFTKIGGTNIYSDEYFKIVDALNNIKLYSLKDRTNIYINTEARRQITQLIELLLVSSAIKVDTNKTAIGNISLQGQVAYDYFRDNIGSEKNRLNKYIYNDYISDDLNKVKMQRELDLIRNYYNLK